MPGRIARKGAALDEPTPLPLQRWEWGGGGGGREWPDGGDGDDGGGLWMKQPPWWRRASRASKIANWAWLPVELRVETTALAEGEACVPRRIR